MPRFFKEKTVLPSEDPGVIKIQIVSIEETDTERIKKIRIEERDSQNKLISLLEEESTLAAMRTEEIDFIEFSQNLVCQQVTEGTLNKIKIKYNGLCEIICNYILLEDLLGKKDPLPLLRDVKSESQSTDSGVLLGFKFKDNTDFKKKYQNKYGEEITLRTLKRVEDTHILNVTNFFTRLIAVLFSIYPCNLFSNSPFAKAPYDCIKSPHGETKTLVDKPMLSERLNKLEVGFYIKFFAFNSTLTSMRGHSMLIKKIAANQYSFFDPNHGEDQNLDIDDLAAQINRSTKENHANKMVFLDAREFITSYQITKKETYDEEDPGSVPMWG